MIDGGWSAAAPGKVLLLGEHAVVYGQPALAAALPRAVRVELVRDPAGPAVVIEGIETPPELLGAFAALCREAGLPDAQLRAHVRSEIPLGGGLGSSAALGVALARAARASAGLPCSDEEAAQLALVLERTFHGAPSGVDPAVSARGGVLLYQRPDLAPGFVGAAAPLIEEVRPARPFGLVVALTGKRRGTKGTVLPLRDRREERPSLYDPLLRALGDLARGGRAALERGDLQDLGVRFDAAHGLLAALGVSCEELEQAVWALRRAGALGAKLTGAGGGGAAIGLAEDAEHADAIVRSLRTAVPAAFCVELGQPRAPRPRPARPRAARRATAAAHANIALVKYWGKRDEALLLPEAASLSVALDRLRTVTTVELGAPADELWLDGKPAGAGELKRARALLDAAGISDRAFIESRNEFPTAAGLASSASGFAALAVAAAAAAGQQRSPRELSALARLGSGSAARSVPGGWAVWRDEAAEQVQPPGHWDVRMVVAVCAAGPKETGSRDGMRSTRDTSPYHAAWIAQCGRDLPEALAALERRDLAALGALAEKNALRMHADALAADPPLLYWQPPTIACLRTLARLRAAGVEAWGTIDAGPHVVALCGAADAARVAGALRAVEGVVDALVCAPAGPAQVLEPAAGDP